MKEKLKKYAKILAKIILIILPLFVIIHEWYWLYIDSYNFQQFEKVKVILKDLKKEDKTFYQLKDFNAIYNTNIQPIKNCYYVNNFEVLNEQGYNFWFLFESWFNQIKYKSEFFVYPKYDIPVHRMCLWGVFINEPFWKNFWHSQSYGCDDINKTHFEWTISKPCRERRK